MAASEQDLAEFVSARWHALVRYGYLLTGSAARAEDLVQEALLRALPHWDRVASEEQYVRKAMARSAWRAERRNRRERELSIEVEPVPEVGAASARSADVARALDALPHGHRAVVILRFWQNLTEAEIADILGCRPGTVKSRASRAYAQLRETLALADYAPPSRSTDATNAASSPTEAP